MGGESKIDIGTTKISWASKYGRIEMTMPRMTSEQRAELFEEMAKWERAEKTQVEGVD